MTRILITPRSLSKGEHTHLKRLKAAGYELVCPAPGQMPTEDMLLRALPGCIGWIAGVEPVSAAVIQAANDLQVISRNGSGVDNLPVQAINDRGILVKRAGGANANAVAELALALTLNGFRHIPITDRNIRKNEWPRVMGREISGSTIGVIGLGAIGALVGQKFLALGANVIGYDPFARPDALHSNENFQQTDRLETLVAQSHAITLHVPMPDDGQPLLSAALLKNVAAGAVIVNTARAGLVDQDAMLDALEANRINAYCVDVFDTEPPTPSKLLQHENTILTAHIGGLTDACVDRITQVTVDNLLAGFEETKIA